MSHITATISAYDCLDSIQVVAKWIDWDEPQHGDFRGETACVTVKSAGEGDARQWLRDALVALIEAL